MVTDGTSLLGADDKAGIVEIMEAICYLQEHPEIKHGTIRIGFTPDEEIGRGPHKFDVDRFNADFAYTMDGSQYGELQYESFNAAEAIITCHGVNVHPGSAKNAMVNAIRLGEQFDSLLPDSEVPSEQKDTKALSLNELLKELLKKQLCNTLFVIMIKNNSNCVETYFRNT